jgi:hypothetical protein
LSPSRTHLPAPSLSSQWCVLGTLSAIREYTSLQFSTLGTSLSLRVL